MRKRTEPKRKVGKSMEADIEMIESTLGQNEEIKSVDEEGEPSYNDLEEEGGSTPNVKSSTQMKSGFAKSVSWSESEENMPSTSKTQHNLGARPKTTKQLKPLIRQKESLEDTPAITDETRESGEESSIIRQATSTSATVTKTTYVVKEPSSRREKFLQRSSQSRSRSAISEEEDTTESEKEIQVQNDIDSSSDEDTNKSDTSLRDDKGSGKEVEEEKETVGPLKKLSATKKKSTTSTTVGDRKGSRRPTLQKQGSRYDIRLREEDHTAQTAFERRQESRREKARTHWGDLRDSVHSGSSNAAEIPTKEESYNFFTKVWDYAPPSTLSTSPQKRKVRDESKKKKKQRHRDSQEELSEDSDMDIGGNDSNDDYRYIYKPLSVFLSIFLKKHDVNF